MFWGTLGRALPQNHAASRTCGNQVKTTNVAVRHDATAQSISLGAHWSAMPWL
ncbi:MAG TPA: hypothetical protein VF629_03725 [Hymenobacter sp.]|uniref:hypothetical protein n=1 Tax=Hymenobacter sp. TaxID=1898978 RepID=UPI002EDAFB5D